MATRLLIGADNTAPDYEFTRADIKSRSLQVVTAVDVVGSELAADELYADVDYSVGEYFWFSPADYDGVMTSDGYIFATADQTEDLTQLPYATPMWLMDGTTVLHKLYFQDATQIDPKTFSLSAISGVGILDRRRHLGKLYTGEAVSAVLDEIIGDAFVYTVEADVASQRVFGLLLPDTARQNLHKLMFALGISLTKSAAGVVQFVFLPSTSSGTIPSGRVFLGGSIEHKVPATAVEVTEHVFYQGTDPEITTLFDNSAKPIVSSILVEFDGPYYGLSATDGLTIEESGSTYAILSGIGILTGYPYVHNTRVIRLDNPSATGGESVIQSDQDTLVNSLNSMSVAERLLAYYTSRKVVKLPIRVDGEKTGQLLSFTDPFGGSDSGFVEKSEAVITGFERANLQIITGYTPTGQGNYYTRKMVIASSQTVTLPTGVTHIRLVLIAGGDGGQGGMNGTAGYGGEQGWGGYLKYVEYDDNKGYVFENGNQAVPEGGAAGAAGAAGKVYVEDMDIASGASITVVVGSSGTGGAVGGNPGTAGTPTTATISGSVISSESGRNTAAYVDLFSGDAYGLEGEAGHPGGDGGQTDLDSLYAYTGNPGYDGGDVDSNSGGSGGTGVDREIMGFDWLTNELYTQHKNLTANGITGTWNADNSAITLNGTATADYENQIIPNSDSELPYRPAVSGGGTLYVRGSGLSNSIKFKLTFLMSDSSTQDVYATSDSTNITIPANAQYVSYAGLVVVSGTALTSAVTVSVTLGTWLRRVRASGGGGGGSAYGADGTDGTAGTWNASSGALVGGSGGNGANASAPTTPAYGCGGGGGNGGGGGGNGAGCRMDDPASGWDVSPGTGGTAGTGSRGGHGGAGVCIIYY